MEISKNLNREEIEKKANSFMRGVDNHKIWGSLQIPRAEHPQRATQNIN